MPTSLLTCGAAGNVAVVMTESELDRDLVRCNDLTAVQDCESLLSKHRLDSLSALFDLRFADVLDKPGLARWRERLRVSLETADGPRTLYLKRFNRPPREARAQRRRSGTGARSAAELEWHWMRHLGAAGVPCPRAVAYGHELDKRCEVRSALLMEEVPGRSLEAWANEWTSSDRQRTRPLLAPLAKLVSRFHDAGYVHRDLYLSHIFFDPSRPVEESLCLIDLHRLMRPGLNRRRWIVKDVAALDYSTPQRLVTRTDRVRWFKQYLGVEKLDDAARALLYRIVAKTGRIARHERRRRRRRVHSSSDS